jgi:hypothetical protein
LRDEIIGGWRKFHNERFNNFCSPPNIITVIKSRRMRWVGHVVRIGAKRNAHRVLVRKTEEETPLGRTRSRWESNIKNDLRETGWSGMDWIDLTQNRDQQWALMNSVMNLRVP